MRLWLLAVLMACPRQESLPTAPPGFRVELLHTATPEEGSWVSMAFDPQGRLLVSPQEGSLRRLTIRPGAPVQVEKIQAPVGDAQGLVYAFGSLYVNGKGPAGAGLYRLFDRDSDGVFEEVRLLRRWPIDMTEHGPHAVVPGPDGKLYVLNGNYTKVPADLSPRSPHRNYAEDLLLPRQWDATGHAVGLLAPGGVVLRTDPDGKEWELFCGGLRNPYDMAFSPDGELFTYESDMERDLGSPWYRPTRIFHLIPGGEYGWRSGTGKWPADYPDGLPSVVDVGRGSPTGMQFGTASRFPPRYRRALFAADWAFGRILAVHLTPSGATYRGAFEPFVTGQPMNVTDLEFGPDGAMYFITGGRGTRTQLFRVSSTEPAAADEQESRDTAARDVRRTLEGSVPLETLWPKLSHPDRWIRYAARLALERLPVESWRDKALSDPKPAALLALARLGGGSDLPPLVERVTAAPWDRLGESEKVDFLRVLELGFTRLGAPDSRTRSRVLDWLDPRYPSGTFPLNRELVQLLVYLEADGVLERSLRLLSDTRVQEEQMHYAFVLRNVRSGWTFPQRERYFRWFGNFADYRGDIGFPLFLRNVRTDALKTVTPDERQALQPILDAQFRKDSSIFQRTAPVVQRWKVEDLRPDVEKPGGRRNFTRGKAAFAKAQCLACHSFAGEGGAVGPDLTGVAKRLNRRDLFEAVFYPSKDVSDQYQNTLYLLDNGNVVLGRRVDEDRDKIVVSPDLLGDERVEIQKKRIIRTKPSALSPMPEGLLDLLTKYEILDLFAYLESDGKEF
jgi:putative heme-binding domain-containing protein